MIKLRFYLFSTQIGCPEAVNRAVCDEAFAGIGDAEQELFGATWTDHWDEFYTTQPEAGELEVLQIKSLPAFVIYDVDRQLALFKFEGSQITRANVANACKLAWQLEADPEDDEGYFLPNGRRVSNGELLATKGCPSWMPDFLCSSYGRRKSGLGMPIWLAGLLALLGLLIVYKMIR